MSRPLIVSEIPGGIGAVALTNEHTTDGLATVHVNQVPVPGPAVNFQLALGAVIVNALIAYALELGLDMVIVIGVAAPPLRTVSLKVIVGRLAFVACADVAMGTNTNIPDSASNASIVPELNLLIYIEDVFKYVFNSGRFECVYKQNGRFVYFL